jgi:hypothetical protein
MRGNGLKLYSVVKFVVYGCDSPKCREILFIIPEKSHPVNGG